MNDRLEELVLGAGLRGLRAALESHRSRATASLRIIDADSRPGGTIRTQRSNGFACELGPFAFTRSEVEPILAELERPPAVVAPECDTGFLFDGAGLQRCQVEPPPISFPSGNEEIVQACRRQLGDSLWLGREVQELRAVEGGGFEAVLGGEVETTVTAARASLALPTAAAAALLAGFDPALASTAQNLRREPRALVFLGGLARDCPELTGYGIVPAESVDCATVEIIHCSNVFSRRCLRDRFLLRSELAGEPALDEDAALVERATDELRRWTGCRAEFGFSKVHRFETVARDGTWAECQTRLRGLETRVPGLRVL